MSSGYISAKDEPNPDAVLEALREAIFDNPRLTEMPSEEVARQLVLDGHLQEEPSPVLVADMLDALEAEESTFDADGLSEEGNHEYETNRVLEKGGAARATPGQAENPRP